MKRTSATGARGRTLGVCTIVCALWLCNSARYVAASGEHAIVPDVVVAIDRQAPDGVSLMDTGVTHDQHSVDSWNDPAAVSRGRGLLQAASTYQNQYIYGWGVTNPEPSPGVYHWSSLDDRVRMMRSMHATMVLTLCCAPDWMTQLGTNTSSYASLPPTPAHIADFAELARRIALRYPDVHYFQVWSEMKGLWDPAASNWDYAAYTDLYNAVYDALKGVNPRIQVGGPYLVIEGTGSNLGDWSQQSPITPRNWETLDFWLQHMHGADFICLDRTVRDDHDPYHYTAAQLLSFTNQLEDITKQIRAHTSLPVWWAEDWFVGGSWNFQAAGLSSMLLHELRGGSSVSLRWNPQGSAGTPNGGNNQNLFSDTSVPNGGKPFFYYGDFKAFHRDFGPGTQLYRATSSSPDVEVLASATRTILINKRDTAIIVSVNGRFITMQAYAVREL